MVPEAVPIMDFGARRSGTTLSLGRGGVVAALRIAQCLKPSVTIKAAAMGRYPLCVYKYMYIERLK